MPFFVLLCLFFSLHIEGNSEIVYRGETKEEAFSFVMYLVKKLPWFNENGYKIALPTHKVFESMYANPKLITEEDEKRLETIFYEEIYDISKFDDNLAVLRRTEGTVKKALEKLAVLEKAWGFKVKSKYEMILTLYGPGGNYVWKGEVGKIITKTNREKSILSLTETIIHEMIHIGIEENIVEKYNLKHWEKERLVDLIGSSYLKDLLPNYREHESADRKIDSVVDEEVILHDLPTAIEAFVAQNPRDPTSNVS